VLVVEHWRRNKTTSPSSPLIIWAIVACLAYVATGVTLWEPLRNHGPTTLVMLVLVAAGFVVLARRIPHGAPGRSRLRRGKHRPGSNLGCERNPRVERRTVGARRQAAPGFGFVAPHLRHQRIEPVELLSPPGSEEGNRRGLAVKVAEKSKTEGLEQRRAVDIDGRTTAEACDAIHAAIRRRGAAAPRSERAVSSRGYSRQRHVGRSGSRAFFRAACRG